MGAYAMGPFNPNPYGAYGNAMVAQMNQMQQLGGFGYGGYQAPYGGAGFSAQAAGLARPQQGQSPEGFDPQQPLVEGYPQSSPGPRYPNFPG